MFWLLRSVLALALIGVVAPTLEASESFSLDGITIENPYAFEVPPTADTGAAYFTLSNTSRVAHRLIAVSTPIASRAEMHTHSHQGAMMTMRRIDEIVVPPNESVSLRPGEMHIMLIGLKERLRAEQVFPLTLELKNLGSIEVKIKVVSRAASHSMQSPSHGDHRRQKATK